MEMKYVTRGLIFVIIGTIIASGLILLNHSFPEGVVAGLISIISLGCWIALLATGIKTTSRAIFVTTLVYWGIGIIYWLSIFLFGDESFYVMVFFALGVPFFYVPLYAFFLPLEVLFRDLTLGLILPLVTLSPSLCFCIFSALTLKRLKNVKEGKEL